MTLPTWHSPLRSRGGQPGNLNARSHGAYSRYSPSFNSILLHNLDHLKQEAIKPSQPLRRLFESVLEQRNLLEARLEEASSVDEILVLLDLRFDLSAAFSRILRQVAEVALPRIELLEEALSPLEYIRLDLESIGVRRDADSFSPASETPAEDPSSLLPSPPHSFFQLLDGSTINSPSFLTGPQWSVLAPLLPPDLDLDHMHGEPPALIAANRWQFTEEVPGPAAASAALEKYRRLTPHSVLHEVPPKIAGKKRGRPRSSPRPLLDAILWKLATGRPWADLPPGCPPWRICQLYYLRLFRSGRLYNLLLALYDDLRLRSRIDPASLVRQGRLTLDPRRRIVLSPGTPDTWETRTSLLFLQLAHAARRRTKKYGQNGIIAP